MEIVRLIFELEKPKKKSTTPIINMISFYKFLKCSWEEEE